MKQNSWPPLRMQWAFFFVLATVSGCGPQLATIKGKVTYQGNPVKGGSLIFSSEGKPAAAAEVKEDGTFSVESRSGNGAEVGQYKISYGAPEIKRTEEQRKDRNYVAPPAEYAGLVVKDATVEVKPGSNDIVIELSEKQ